LAEEMAEKSMVLLKNDGNALPFGAGIDKVAVIGASVQYDVRSDNPRLKTFNFVTDPAMGDRGSSRVSTDPALTAGPLDGIRAAAPNGIEIVYGDSAAAVGDADAVIVIAGLTAGDEGEEYTGASDRESLTLGTVHDNLINAVADLGKPTVVVIEAGGVVDMPWINSVQAVVMAWYPGQRGGAAMGNLIFGSANFAGRLPVTWPTSADQFPIFNEGDTTNMDYYVGYRRFDQLGMTPLFAFGHGLSYSTFSYERLHMPCGEVDHEGVFNVEVDVRNTSGPAGDEVLMVFASYPETKTRRSMKELKAFARVNFQAGEAKRVQIPVRVEDLKYWDRNENKWAVESGPVLIQVGPSSDRLLLSQTIVVNK
jgi:beta-glucosidase